jgi:glycosyltransferase involved in cell wall biosynthesis
VDVITFREPGAADPAAHFPTDVGLHVIDLPFHSRTAAARAIRNLRRAVRGIPPLTDRFGGFNNQLAEAIGERRYALGVIEHFWCAPYAEVLRESCARLVLNLHNVESVLLDRSAAVSPAPQAALLRRFAARSRSLERIWIRRFDTVLVTSDDDAARVGVPAVVYPNAIPFMEQPRVEKADSIAFSGNLEYEPNQAAVRWFRERVWPRLREARPTLNWRLIGKNSHAVQRYVTGDERIVVTGPVPDAVKELARNRTAVVPVVSGSGTRVKIVEAWAAGLPVVSTTLGAEGLPGCPGKHLLIADSPEDFGAAVLSVIESEQLQAELGASGRRLYEERLTWEAAWCTLTHWGL